jgi:triphosphatase
MSVDSPKGAPETELKFKLGEGAMTALSKHPKLSKPARKSRLRSVYFDTPEHDLRNAGYSLRVREKDGAFVQTVKRSGEASSFKRDEWEFLVEGVKVDLAALAKTPAGALLNGGSKRLAPMFETLIDRTVSLVDDGESIVEVAFDKGEVIAGGKRAPVREMELELRAGDPSALFGLAGELAGQAPMRLSFETKAERGYRLSGHDGAAAIKAERAAITPKTTTEEAFRQIARGALGQISANASLLGSSRSPQVLHQTRVGLRRLRSALDAFKPMLDDKARRRIKESSGVIAAELDSARDIDVYLIDHLGMTGDELAEDSNVAALQQRALQAQAEAYDHAAQMLSSTDFASFLLELAEFVEVGALARRAEGRVADHAAKTLDKLRRQVRKLGRDFRDLDAVGRHELRLRVKTLRYASEFFAGATKGAPRRKRRYVMVAKTLQDQLGQLNDLVVARETSLRIVGPRASALAFTAGAIVGARAQSEPLLLAEAARSLRVLNETRPFWR